MPLAKHAPMSIGAAAAAGLALLAGAPAARAGDPPAQSPVAAQAPAHKVAPAPEAGQAGKGEGPTAAAKAKGAAQAEEAPEGAGIFLPMQGLNPTQVGDLLDVVRAKVRGQLGYHQTPAGRPDVFTATPAGLTENHQLVRQVAQGDARYLELGFRNFASQPPYVWLFGVDRRGGKVVVNPDLKAVHKMLDQVNKTRAARAAKLGVADLATRKIDLSYIQVDRCLGLLKAMGYDVIEYTAKGKSASGDPIITPNAKLDPAHLPIVMPLPAASRTAKVGGVYNRKQLDQAADLPKTGSGPTTQLLVFYDPAKPEQYGRVLSLIHDKLDKPARQIVIEALVLEISESGLKRLGVKWQLQPFDGSNGIENLQSLVLGRLPQFEDNNGPTLNVEAKDVFGRFRVQLQTLIQDGQAQVLSRPSVLTLDNRQAFIRVGEDIPVATGASGLRSGDKLSFDFDYIPVGIRLNVRPRVTADGQEVSLQVDGSVSAEVPGQDLVLRDQNGNVLARAPRLSQRVVQTYTRIANNTPFIIGGLVSHDRTQTVQKVPILGDIPLIKYAFRNTVVNRTKREVIIVITPYVLPEQHVVGRNLPKDKDVFDSFGNKLFRDAYRIRTEDVFDLSFITNNARLRQMQRLTHQVIDHNPDLKKRYPFRRFANGRFPGERILVYRQMYEVLKRKDISENLDPERLIFFKPDADLAKIGTFGVDFLAKYLRRRLDMPRGASLDRIFAALQHRHQALAMTFTRKHFSINADDLLSEPVPSVKLVHVPDRDAWEKELWKLNQPGPDGKPRSGLLLGRRDDLTRLKRAILLKRTVKLNATRHSLTLDNFSIGRLLLLPTVDRSETKLIDGDVARYFFYTEQYYPALRKALIHVGQALWDTLRQPKYRRLLDHPGVVDQPLRWNPLPGQ